MKRGCRRATVGGPYYCQRDRQWYVAFRDGRNRRRRKAVPRGFARFAEDGEGADRWVKEWSAAMKYTYVRGRRGRPIARGCAGRVSYQPGNGWRFKFRDATGELHLACVPRAVARTEHDRDAAQRFADEHAETDDEDREVA